MPKSIHSTPLGKKWVVKKSNQDKPVSTHWTQVKAIEAGRTEAKQLHVEHVIHGRDGKIREKNSYGIDPKKTKG